MADLITINRATVEQVLEALVWEAGSEPALYAAQTDMAITTLRAALAQAEPVQPVACSNTFGCRCPKHFAAQQAEPVAWMESPYGVIRANPAYKIKFPSQLLHWQIPLFIAPQQSEPCDMGQMCLNCQPRGPNGECPDKQAEPTRSQKLADAGFSRRPGLWALQARKALELIATPQRPDGTWNRDREACRQLAAEALGRYDDE